MSISWLIKAFKAVLGLFSADSGGTSMPRDPGDPVKEPEPAPVGTGDDRWDLLIRKYASQYQIPWFIVKAVMWQESRFKPTAKSHCGACGLMQLMPVVYEDAGIDPFNPEDNIRVGCSHLKGMWNIFKAESGLERWKFALGSYNAGAGYIISAQALAKNKSARTDKWYHISVLLDRAEVNRRRCDWKQVTEYVDLVIGKMYEYILLHKAGKTIKEVLEPCQ